MSFQSLKGNLNLSLEVNESPPLAKGAGETRVRKKLFNLHKSPSGPVSASAL